MCDPDIGTTFYLFDRVVNVRLGTGVPIGTRGTVIGIMLGRTNLDTYYEILFDNLPSNSLESILLGKNQQKSRIKVRSYHLLNYSHSLRLRSMNYQTQRSTPSNNVWQQRPFEQTPRSQQQQQPHVSKKESDKNNTSTKPKSAPPLMKRDQPDFVEDKEQKSTTDIPIQPMISPENTSSVPSSAENLPHPQITSTSTNDTMPKETFVSSFPPNSASNALFFRAIQDSEPIQNSGQQSLEPNSSIPFQSSGPVMHGQQTWEASPTQYFQNPCML
jgi:hypothetical protein